MKVEIAYAMEQHGGDSGHGTESDASDKAARVLKFPEALPVKGYDHPDDNSAERKSYFRGKIQVIIVRVKGSCCESWRLILSKYEGKVSRTDAQ